MSILDKQLEAAAESERRGIAAGLSCQHWGDVPDDGFFGLDRTKPLALKHKPLTRWLRARWWLAYRIEWLACLVGGDRWCP